MLALKFPINKEYLAKSNTEWLVQVVNGMLRKGVLGYAENITRQAVQQHRISKGFSW